MAAPLIALYSPVMQSGKSEVAKVLVGSRNYKLVKFADPIKEIVAGLLLKGGADEATVERMLEGDLKERIIPALGVSTRTLFQTLGSWGRSIHPDFWVNLTRPRVEGFLKAGFEVAIDDMRYPNEYEMVLRLGGHPVKVVRTGTQPYQGHASEGLLEAYPMTILQNNSTLGELRACAENLPELLSQ